MAHKNHQNSSINQPTTPHPYSAYSKNHTPKPSIIAHISNFVKRLSQKCRHLGQKIQAFVKENPLHTLVGALIIASAAILIFSLTALYLQNPYRGQQATIKNLSDYTKNLPQSSTVLDYIRYDLYRTISYNTREDPAALSDILVRDGTFSQTHDESTDIYTTTFLVDIASLAQTYRVSYQWSPSHPRSNDLDEYGTIVTCPLPTELIYGDFACQDALTTEAMGTDPIAAHLPYISTYFRIDSVITPEEISAREDPTSETPADSDNPATSEAPATSATSAAPENYASATPATPKPQLLVTFLINRYETSDPTAFAETIKPSVEHWITSLGLDPTAYDLLYTIEVN